MVSAWLLWVGEELIAAFVNALLSHCGILLEIVPLMAMVYTKLAPRSKTAPARIKRHPSRNVGDKAANAELIPLGTFRVRDASNDPLYFTLDTQSTDAFVGIDMARGANFAPFLPLPP